VIGAAATLAEVAIFLGFGAIATAKSSKQLKKLRALWVLRKFKSFKCGLINL